jgi:hypothetical protein
VEGVDPWDIFAKPWYASRFNDLSKDLRHGIQLHHTSILCTEPRYTDYFNRKAVEIELRPNSINREGGFSLSKSRNPLICSLKDSRNHHLTAELGSPRSQPLHAVCLYQDDLCSIHTLTSLHSASFRYLCSH